MIKDYYLGLDMGTSSVGWAVTDEKYNILRAKGKDLWGIREFDEANTAAERRTKRISRRRHQRELVRAGFIRLYFDDAIKAVDPNFYVRLDNSMYHADDKDALVYNINSNKQNAIFDDDNYKDADYYEQYPTIFHLRKDLIRNENAPYDVRLVYLAVSNIFKHRGHFLDSGLSENDTNLPTIEAAYNIFIEYIDSLAEIDAEQFSEWDERIALSINHLPDFDKMEEILSDKNISRTDKSKRVAELLGVTSKNKRSMEFVKLMTGLKVDIRNLFPEITLDEKTDVCFSDAGYDEICEELRSKIGDEYFDIITSVKNIYDICALSGILKGKKYLSYAKVENYEKHGYDLSVLKKVIREFCTKEQYDDMFRNESENSYSAYVRSFNSGTNKGRRKVKLTKREDLYKKITTLLKDANKEDKDVQYVLKEIATDNFLPKQRTSENGIIPNQIHKRELMKILDNARNYLTFLNDVDESGYSVVDRIGMLFSFQIPYYIGPTSENSQKYNGNGWVIRKEPGMVLPWNLEDKIDVKKTSEQFIYRLIRECSYLSGEKVLPKDSMLYQKYCVLNEINNIKIDGENIDVSLKKRIYNEIFKKGKRVTRKALCRYLVAIGIITDEEQVSGIDITINNALTTYGKFSSLFGDKLEQDCYKELVEDIVRWCVIYGDSKAFLKEQLLEKYGDILNENDIKKIIGFKFKDWGRLSREFLLLEGSDETGETVSLIEAMWNTNYNMMELINDERFMFKNNLEQRRKNQKMLLSEFKAEDMNEYYFSAPVKRMVWQTLLIIKELQSVLGKAPKRVFIEMTRSDEEKGDKGRKNSRKNQLMELYKNIQDESRDWNELIAKSDENGTLRSKKMYLYITQMGKCMYTGHHIDLDKLFDDSVYDIDHIYPRSLVKDDNLSNNLVLVERQKNKDKDADYPLSADILSNSNVTSHWHFLKEKNLITEEKYKRLTCRVPFTDEQKAGFIARQLVETSQGTKGVADLLKQLLPKETTIVYAKASNVSDFRRDKNFTKSRLVNEFHHAQDAYLNIVVGNVYFVKFTNNPLNFIKKDLYRNPSGNHYHLSKMFDWDVIRGDEVAWISEKKPGSVGTIETVKKMIKKNTPLMTRMSIEGRGAIAKETLHSASKAKVDTYIPIKTADARLANVLKYGGFSDITTAYFSLIEYEKKGKKIRALESIPLYIANKKSEKAIHDYCASKYGSCNVVMKKIKLQSLVKYNGYLMYITGKMNGGDYIVCRNAVNLCVDPECVKYIKALEKAQEKNIIDDISIEGNIKLYDMLLDKFRKIYSKNPKTLKDTISLGRDKFVNLALEEQIYVLIQILNNTKVLSTISDLQYIGGKKNAGTMYISKIINENNHVVLVNQSVTGIYEQTIDLLMI